jgi:peptidoglycan hydrolase-like protein with peptidoglycan-binding domain
VQTKLAEQSYYQGSVDGVIGSTTLQAIRQYQTDHGLAVTGKIDPKLLDALGVEYKQEKLKADYSIPKKPAEVTIR